MKCPTCNGKGQVPDPAIDGAKLRKKRERANLTLRLIAERMDVSVAFLSMVENGKRRFTPEQTSAFIAALRQLSKSTRK